MTEDEALRRAEDAELTARAARQDDSARRGRQGDELVSPLADADERDIEGALRPKRLAEFTGQARVRRTTCCWPGRQDWARPRSR
jgi:hypothetical protein